MPPVNRPLFIAVGNRYRRDDGVAVMLAERLAAENLPIEIVEASDDLIRLVDLWRDREFVVVADAVVAGEEPGTIYRRDPLASQLPRHWFGFSSHQLGIMEAIELGRAVQRLPHRMLFVGIEVADVSPGEGLTREVARALTPAVHVVRAALTWEFSGLFPAAGRRAPL